jgi:hypothetical protein
MKKWLQNLSGAVMASLLAVTLSGKSYADAEEPQTLPAEAPTQVVESAVPVPVEAMPVAAPVSAAEEAAPVKDHLIRITSPGYGTSFSACSHTSSDLRGVPHH